MHALPVSGLRRSSQAPCWERIRAGLSNGANLCFLALIIIHLLPIWTFTYFPSTDGPAHLDNAHIIREYHDRPIFREYYLFNTKLVPTWCGHLVLAGLLSLMPALVAEKVLLSGYVILLPLAMRYALRTLRPDAGFLAILAFPFIYNYFLHMGFYSFSYSLVLFFFVVGYWLKYREGFTRRALLRLALLSLGLYGCHIFALVTAYVAMGLLALWWMGCDVAQQRRQRPVPLRGLWTALRTRVLVPCAALLPTLLLVATFVLQQGTATLPRLPAATLWGQLYHLDALISYDEREGWFSTALVWLFITVLGYRLVVRVTRRRGNRWDGLLLVVTGYVVIYFLAPTAMSQGGFISSRMSLFPFFALILWFGAHAYPRMVKWGIQGVAAGLALALLGLHVQKYAELNDYLAEYLSGMHLIASNTTLLPLIFSPQGYTPDGRVLASRVAPFIHASGHIAVQRGIVDLSNYEAHESIFPLIFRPHLRPSVHIWYGLQSQSPQVDFQSYPQRTGGRVDYVLVWNTREESPHDPLAKSYLQFYQQLAPSIARQLAEDYELIYTSPQRDCLQLYRHKAWRP